MIQSMNLPLTNEYAEPFGGWEGLRAELGAAGLDGVEGIWAGVPVPEEFPADLLTGYHLTLVPYWVDFFRERTEIIKKRFGSEEKIALMYGGTRPEDLIRRYREDVQRALDLGAGYMVIHVSDVSIEESYTYRWEHSDEEVIDASLDLIREILRGVPESFDFLVENQWWAGFTFTDPKKTDRLLNGIGRERAGIMLDTGHLMNANPALRSQADGAAWVLDCIDAHGQMAEKIRGVHLHQSVSGEYVRAHTGAVPPDLPETYFEAFEQNYEHILQIDRHRPWTDPACARILERVQPAYLTHELSARGRAWFDAARVQIENSGIPLCHADRKK